MSTSGCPLLIADDYAHDEGVSAAIVDLLGRGRIQGTSVMVLAPDWPSHAKALRPWRGRVQVGLHLDATSPWAGRAGVQRGLGAALCRAHARLESAAALRRSVQQQLDAFEEHWGAPPDHIDGHQHIQQLPQWREALQAELLRRHGQGQRPWLRVSRVDQPGFKARVISATGARALHDWARAAAWPVKAPLWGVYDFQGGQARFDRLMQGWLARQRACGDGVIMCHPGQGHQPDDPIRAARQWEWAHLSSPEFALQLAALGGTPKP